MGVSAGGKGQFSGIGDEIMCPTPYWNHNVAYYDWVEDRTAGCRDILDVGCGDGSLVRCLDDGKRSITGIDVDEECIKRALDGDRQDAANTQFICGRFETYEFQKQFDAVIFVASIHHMDMTAALEQARSILRPGGVILIVGLAKPSNFLDWAVEALRVIPCAIVSKVRQMQSSEEKHIPVSYHFPKMSEIRAVARTLLPSAKIRYGLFYRYLLWWKKQ